MLHWMDMRRRARPTIPDDVPFALLTRIDGSGKPWAYATLDELARRIHRDREGEELILSPFGLQTRDGKLPVVSIATPTRWLGCAWIGGRDQVVLIGALRGQYAEAA